MSRSTEVRALVPCIRAILALREEARATALLAREAFEMAVLNVGHIDCFVCAYRAYPPLLNEIYSNTQWRPRIWAIIEEAHDHGVAKSIGLPVQRRLPRSSQVLSPREREVFALLAQGLSNKEIASSLYITVSTVKVHVRHIFEKLGVRSRMAAALRATGEEGF